jgi:acyl-CoA hydrolase
LRLADISILEVNPNFPRTFGDLEVHISEVDYLIEVDYYPPTSRCKPNEKDIKSVTTLLKKLKMVQHFNLALVVYLMLLLMHYLHKKDLGIHTEMFTTGLMQLVKSGAANGKKKKHIMENMCVVLH